MIVYSVLTATWRRFAQYGAFNQYNETKLRFILSSTNEHNLVLHFSHFSFLVA